MTKTRIKTVSTTKLAVATGVLIVAGGAAFAALGGPSTRGYQNFYTQCHDGSTYQDDGTVSIRDGRYHAPTHGCQTPAQWQAVAQSFCTGATNSSTGKVGVNTYKISDRCTIPPVSYGYGYGPGDTGYGYGATDGYGYGSEKATKTKKRSFKNFFKKKRARK